MYEYQNSVLCIQGSWLIEQGILSESYYKQLCFRKQLEKINVGGNGRKALIKFDTIKQDIKAKIIAITGDPKETAKHITFTDYLKPDSVAIDFFNDYRLENGDGLPEKNIAEYCANADVLQAIDLILATTMSKRKALGSKVKPWEKIAAIVAQLQRGQWPHSLPANEKRLRDRYNAFKKEGYQSLVHKGFGHKNAEKISDEAKYWVLARWADRVNRCANYGQLLREYNAYAEQNEWKVLMSEQTLQNFLQDPKIEPMWHGHRFGELKSKEKYSYQHTTKLASIRDSLWYSDGTKLNYFYQDAQGKRQTCQVYEVIDSFSEVFLGYHISKSEDYDAQFNAYKMAIQTAGHKPYEIKYDNQGGTKKLEAQSFLGKISKINTNTQPYNGKSKTIESAFGRFQTQFLKQDWFFTGQNITATKSESKANMEFILKNSSSLPTLDEIKAVYAKRRQQWNEAPHPKTGVSRIEMYLNSENPATPAITVWEMIELFWIERDKPVTCTAQGISFTEKKIEYQYIVYDDERMPDIRWLRDNVDKKFVVKFNPDDMTLIYLFEKTPLGLRRVAAAETKVAVHRGVQEQEDWENEYIRKINEQNKVIRIEARDEMDAILAEHNRLPEDYGLKSPVLHGIESSRKKQSKKEKTTIGEYQKAISNVALTENTETDIYSIM